MIAVFRYVIKFYKQIILIHNTENLWGEILGFEIKKQYLGIIKATCLLNKSQNLTKTNTIDNILETWNKHNIIWYLYQKIIKTNSYSFVQDVCK